ENSARTKLAPAQAGTHPASVLNVGWHESLRFAVVRSGRSAPGRDHAYRFHRRTILTDARDAIRSMRRKGVTDAVTVLIHGGTYRLADTFVLTPEDSDVTYAAYPGERPIVSGGRRITGWQKGKGAVWSAPAPFAFHQMFVNG